MGYKGRINTPLKKGREMNVKKVFVLDEMNVFFFNNKAGLYWEKHKNGT